MHKAMSVGVDWKGRLLAAAVHFVVTLCVASSMSALIFFLWFPGPFAEMVGGVRLLYLVVVSDIILGPLISLVIFNRKKPRKELVTDYAVVGCIQLAALLYGIYAVSVSRPVIVAFLVDRFEVVTRIELEDSDLAEAKDPQYRSVSWARPRLVYVELPSDIKERNDLAFSAVAGKDAELMPKYYRGYDQGVEKVKEKAQPVNSLLAAHPEKSKEVEQAIEKLEFSKARLLWLPVHHRFGFYTVLIDAESGYPVKYLPIDPY